LKSAKNSRHFYTLYDLFRKKTFTSQKGNFPNFKTQKQKKTKIETPQNKENTFSRTAEIFFANLKLYEVLSTFKSTGPNSELIPNYWSGSGHKFRILADPTSTAKH
jgi:hypothetical protein